MLTDFGKDWRRSLTFSIPVRHPEVWKREEVQELLVDTLGFLSESRSGPPRRLARTGRPCGLDRGRAPELA
jgi:hypothetical protein